MRYDDRLKCYIISSNELGKYSIDYLNKFSNRLLIEYPNTTALTTGFVRSINNPKVGYRIVGGYDKSKIDYWTARNKNNPEVRKGKYKIPGLTYYEDSNIYNRETMLDILKEIESIEKEIVPGWSDIKKALYVYDRLREKIIYHPDYEKQESFDIRTLRGLVSKKTVCAGYAIIFKEFMDRLGIECQYVEGSCSKADKQKDRTTHAWNIIKVHGEYFPIDLTWDAGEYRQGKNDSFGWFSQLDRFKKKHYPHSTEPLQDYSKLRGLKRKYVKKTIDSFRNKVDYSESVIKVKSADGEMVYVTQLEKVRSIADAFDPVYRYVVAKKDKNGKYTDYQMVFSESNLLNIVYQLQWKKISVNGPEVNGMAQLFSYSNIDKAKRVGSSYIGRIYLDKSNSRGYRFLSKKSSRVKYPDKSGQFTRKNGDKFIVFENPGYKIVDGEVLYTGYVGSFTDDGYREYKVCSEKSLFDDNVRGREASFYSSDFLDRRGRFVSGYLGNVNDSGSLEIDNNLEELFDTRNPGDIKRNDVVWENNVYNSKYVTIPEFEDVKNLFLKYIAKYSDDFSSFEMVDRETDEKITDDRLKLMASFAAMWVGCAGSKYMYGEEYAGMEYAFNEGSSLVYDYIISKACRQLETIGVIDFDSFSDTDMENSGYCSYKYAYDIIDKMTQTPSRRKILFDYCNLQVESYIDERAAKIASNYVDTGRKGHITSMFYSGNSNNSGNYSSGGEKK